MAFLQEALSSSFEGEPSPQMRGKLFELALKQALKVHPGEWGRSRFTGVWSWREWPDRENLVTQRSIPESI